MRTRIYGVTHEKAIGRLSAIVFFSGISALIYEVVWREEISLFFGRTWEATAIVLAVFMGGSALGAWIFSRFSDKAGNPLIIYSFLETGTGFSALLVPTVLGLVFPIYKDAAQRFGFGPELMFIKAVSAGTAIALPSILMGGTLPILARFAAGGSFGKDISLVYGAGMIGAFAGAWLSSFVLLPGIGLAGTLLAGVTNTLAMAFFAARLAGKVSPTKMPAEEKEGEKREGFIDLAAFISGAVILALEVVFTRILALTIGSSVYAFGLMLMSFLLGLGAGSIVSSKAFARNLEPSGVLAFGLSTGGLLLLFDTLLIGLSPWVSAFLVERFSRDFSLFSIARFCFLFLVISIPVSFLGLVLPSLFAWAARRGVEGRMTGRTYFFNTLGSMTGPLLAGFFLLPRLGSRASIIVCAVILLALSLALTLRAKKRILLKYSSSLLAAGLALCALLPGWNRKLLTSGFYIYALHQKKEGLKKSLERKRILYFAEGTGGTITTLEFKTRKGETRRTYSVNGKYEGSTNPDDMITQTRVGEIPLSLCRRKPERVFLLGVGTGTTIASILRYPVRRVDVAEISREVVYSARKFFADYNNRALEDGRVKVHFQDGRHFLAVSGKKWDVVISEPTNPWMKGVSFLFTKEAFEEMKRHVLDGGVVCQWVQAYLLTEEHYKTVMRTWLSVFPRSFLFLSHVETTDTILVGFVGGNDRELKIDWKTLKKRLDSRKRYPFGGEFAPKNAFDLFHSFVMGAEGLKSWVANGPIETDDFPLLQFEAPMDLYKKGLNIEAWEEIGDYLENPLKYLENLDRGSAITVLNNHAYLVMRIVLGKYSPDSALLPARKAKLLTARMLALSGSVYGAGSWLVNWLAGKYLAYYVNPKARWLYLKYAPGYKRDLSIQALKKAISLSEGKRPEPLLELALLFERGTDGEIGGIGSLPGKALDLALKAVGIAPYNKTAVLLASRLLIAAGRKEEAKRLLLKFLDKFPGSKEARALLKLANSI